MNFNSNSFTYGVEIEGLFTKKLVESLKLKCKTDVKSDGSVRTSNIFIKKVNVKKDALYNCQEINLGIFKKQGDMLGVLKMVESDKSHFWDASCGLHLHIQAKKNNNLLNKKIFDKQFIDSLQKYAFNNLCSHIKPRQKNYYCKAYRGLKQIVGSNHGTFNRKYRFVRYHDVYNTFEFRFFTPCEHKLDNVKKFMDYFIMEIKKVPDSYKHTFLLNNTHSEKLMNLTHKLEIKEMENVEMNLKIDDSFFNKGNDTYTFESSLQEISRRFREISGR